MDNKFIFLKRLLAIGIFLFVILLNIPQSISINTIKPSFVIDSNKNTLYVGGTGEDNYTKIQEAIYNASSGDTIFVYDDSSPYIENVRIFKSITLVGEEKNTTIIDGGGWGNVLYVISDGVEIKGFTITNGRCGLIINSIYNYITNNIIINNIDGLVLSKSQNEITGNYFSKNVYGINADDSHNNTIKNNIFFENVGSLFMLDCNRNLINNNKINKNSGGIILLESDNFTIKSNNIHNNNYGVYLKKSKNIEIISNNISSNNLYGIWLYNSSHNKIVTNNNISNNNNGIRLRNFCYNNSVYKNNFLNNSQNAIDECNNSWDNGKYGNYWSDYIDKYPKAKKKTLKPWMWDIPYKIDGGKNTDNCPLIKQWSKSDILNSIKKSELKSNHFSLHIFNRIQIT
jgi:parallel beta-helix repeat protein